MRDSTAGLLLGQEGERSTDIGMVGCKDEGWEGETWGAGGAIRV
jgi:hypothetical protein